MADDVDVIHQSLVRFLSRELGDVGRAEEVAGRTLRIALRQSARASRGTLFAVAVRALNSQRREYRNRIAVEPRSAAMPLEMRTWFALSALTEHERAVLLLHCEDLSYQDIAQAIHVSPQSVASTLVRAEGRLLEFCMRSGDHCGAA